LLVLSRCFPFIFFDMPRAASSRRSKGKGKSKEKMERTVSLLRTDDDVARELGVYDDGLLPEGKVLRAVQPDQWLDSSVGPIRVKPTERILYV